MAGQQRIVILIAEDDEEDRMPACAALAQVWFYQQAQQNRIKLFSGIRRLCDYDYFAGGTMIAPHCRAAKN